MMKYLPMKLFITTLLILSFIFPFGVRSVDAVGSFGITPPYVINDSLEPGSVHEQRIFIVRRDASKELQADITWNVPGAEGWVTIDRGDSFILPMGEQRVPMTVRVEVPEDVTAGTYQGTLQVAVGAPDETEQSAMIAVGLRARATVDLTVLFDGVSEQPNSLVAGAIFSGLIAHWYWGLLSLFLLLFFVVVLRSTWARKKLKLVTR